MPSAPKKQLIRFSVCVKRTRNYACEADTKKEVAQMDRPAREIAVFDLMSVNGRITARECVNGRLDHACKAKQGDSETE